MLWNCAISQHQYFVPYFVCIDIGVCLLQIYTTNREIFGAQVRLWYFALLWSFLKINQNTRFEFNDFDYFGTDECLHGCILVLFRLTLTLFSLQMGRWLVPLNNYLKVDKQAFSYQSKEYKNFLFIIWNQSHYFIEVTSMDTHAPWFNILTSRCGFNENGTVSYHMLSLLPC